MSRGYRLGIDFGTSNTVAVLAWPDGHAKPLLFDGSPLLPSSVFADPAAGLLVGRDAVHAARAAPERFEPHPKRRVDEGLVLLGDAEVAVADLVAAVLGRVVAESRRVAGTDPGEAVLTHPAAWGPPRRGVLAAAARAAGLTGIGLVAEPVAAAAYFRAVVGSRLPAGAAALVFDLGAGTFDATVIRADADGCTVLGTRGLDDAGGLYIDGAIVAHLGATYAARDPDAWRRLTEPASTADRRASRMLWDDVRAGKEALSRLAATVLHVPLVDADAPLGREQLDQLARPTVDRSMSAVHGVLHDAGVTAADLAAVFLVGGGSRLPLVATVLHRTLGIAPTVIEQPELVVAEGSLHAPPTAPPAVVPAAPLVVEPVAPTLVAPSAPPVVEPAAEEPVDAAVDATAEEPVDAAVDAAADATVDARAEGSADATAEAVVEAPASGGGRRGSRRRALVVAGVLVLAVTAAGLSYRAYAGSAGERDAGGNRSPSPTVVRSSTQAAEAAVTTAASPTGPLPDYWLSLAKARNSPCRLSVSSSVDVELALDVHWGDAKQPEAIKVDVHALNASSWKKSIWFDPHDSFRPVLLSEDHWVMARAFHRILAEEPDAIYGYLFTIENPSPDDPTLGRTIEIELTVDPGDYVPETDDDNNKLTVAVTMPEQWPEDDAFVPCRVV